MLCKTCVDLGGLREVMVTVVICVFALGRLFVDGTLEAEWTTEGSEAKDDGCLEGYGTERGGSRVYSRSGNSRRGS